MSRTLTIDVTEEDIAAGIPDSCGQCPIALAMQRSGLDYALAEYRCLVWQVGGRRVGVDTPDHARAFMRSFDDGEEVAPFSFAITLPEVES